MQTLGGLSGIAENYDAFIFDLWGVIYNGVEVFPDVPDCLAQLKAAGKKICFLSNSPMLAIRNIKKIEGLGIRPDQYNFLLTSGEVAYQELMNGMFSGQDVDFKTFYHLGPPEHEGLYEALPFKQDGVEDAEFVIATGPVSYGVGLAAHEDILKKCLVHDLLLLCPNPDLLVHHGGTEILCPGALAARYEEMGGATRYVGKPHAQVYDRCFDLLGVAPNRILAVGDNLDTDIKGANDTGMDSVLILEGIHVETLRDTDINTLCDQHDARPTAVMPCLTW